MAAYLRQGTLKFIPGYKLQTRWGLSEATVFALECAGAPLIALAAYAGASLAALWAGLIMVALAIVLLLRHLGRPERAWRAISNLRHSWISRGSVALGAVVGLGLLYVLMVGTQASALAGAAGTLLTGVLICLGVFVGAYPGLVLSSSPAIAFWNSALLPVLSLLQGASTSVLMLLALGGAPQGTSTSSTVWSALWLLVGMALVLALYLASMLRRGAAAAESARYLMLGHAAQFIGLACIVGIGLPLILMLWTVAGSSGHFAALCGVAAVARLGGDVALRHSFLKVGMYDPVI
jgi:sulfite dehydrogenase (quinone) subunit SoeC